MYNRWDSFYPTKQKINLIKSLKYRTLIICSKIDEEIKLITGTLDNNGFRLNLINP